MRGSSPVGATNVTMQQVVAVKAETTQRIWLMSSASPRAHTLMIDGLVPESLPSPEIHFRLILVRSSVHQGEGLRSGHAEPLG